MSPRRPTLSHPAVITGVLVVLLVIIVVNVRTFGPGRSGARQAEAARVQAYPAIPLDLADVLRQADRPSGALGVAVTGPRPALDRDPFVTGPPASVVRTAPASPTVRTGVRTAPAARGCALICAAVMLGGGVPAALIDGRLCRVGDTVRQYRVERIDVHGVTLGGDSRLFLPVGVTSAGEGANVLVTGSASGDGLGRTSLVEYSEGERK